MKTLLHYVFLASFLILTLAPSTSVGQENYQEVTYEDLLSELSAKSKRANKAAHSPFDSIMIHTGFGLTTGANQFRLNNQDTYRTSSGFQISLGIDLFSANWAAEGSIRNFGTNTSKHEYRSLREFDLKVMNREMLKDKVGYRLGGGIGTRYLKFSDSSRSIYLNETTPTTLLFAGVDNYINKNISLGLEAGLRSAMISKSADRNSLDVTIRMDTYY